MAESHDILVKRYPEDRYRVIRLAVTHDQFEWLIARAIHDDVAPSDLVQGLISNSPTFNKFLQRKH